MFKILVIVYNQHAVSTEVLEYDVLSTASLALSALTAAGISNCKIVALW